MIHPRVLFNGDPAAAAPYVGIAKKLARQTFNARIRSKTYKVGEATIRVENTLPAKETFVEGYQQMFGGISKVWIQAVPEWGFFVETGWIYLSSINCVDEDKEVGKLTVTDDMKLWVFDEKEPFVDWLVVGKSEKTDTYRGEEKTRNYKTGMESLALPKYTFETDDEREANAFGLTEQERIMGYKSLMARKYFVGCGIEVEIQRPSTIGGKLKYLFQSTLGKQEATEDIIQQVGKPMWGNEGYGLFTTKDWKYYIIRIIPNGVTVYETKQPKSAKKIKELLNKEKDFDKKFRLEAYLLSITTIKDHAEDESLRYVKFGAALEIIGDPIAYGWHFSWKGHQASIVVHTVEDDNTLISSRYLLEFSENEAYDNQKEWSSSNTPLLSKQTCVEKNVQWYAPLSFLVWRPEWLGEGLTGRMEFFNPRYDFGYQGFSFDAPLYCFYDHTVADNEKDSELVVVRAKLTKDTTTRKTVDVLQTEVEAQIAAVVTEEGGSYSFGGEYASKDVIEMLTEGHSDDVSMGGDIASQVLGTLELSVADNGYPPFTFSVGTYEGETVRQTNYGGNGRSISNVITRDTATQTILLIPFFSSEAVFIGDYTKVIDTSTFIDRTASLIMKAYYSVIDVTVKARLSLWMYPSSNSVNKGGIDWFLANCGGGVSSCDHIVDNSYPIPKESTLRCTVLHSWGIEKLKFREDQDEEWKIKVGDGILPGIEAWDDFFIPDFIERLADPQFWFYNGVSVASYFTNDISMANDEDHAELAWQCLYGIKYDTRGGYFVGWA